MVRRIAAVKIVVLAATVTGLMTLAATSAYADEPAPPTTVGDVANPSPTPSPTSAPDGNPWD